jgi:DNA-binding transcriptional regulator YhcF (GntR family)
LAVIEFHLDSRSGVPFYVQVVRQVRQAVRFGRLGPGDQLPTVREVVGSVAVNPNTVLRAYRELEHEGLVVMRAGLGTFVTDRAGAAIDEALSAALRSELERWIASARARGADDETLAALFDHVLTETRREVTT